MIRTISIVTLLLMPVIARAQSSLETAKKLRQDYDICVYSTAVEYWAANKTAPMPKAVLIEQAFLGCTTEEARMRALLGSNGVITSPQIDGLIANVKSQLKQELMNTLK